MQAMDLRFDQMVNTAKSIPQEKTSGLSFSNQNDSSFKVALENAQKDIENSKSEKVATQTTDGNKKLESQNEISQMEEKYLSQDEVSKVFDSKIDENSGKILAKGENAKVEVIKLEENGEFDFSVQELLDFLENAESVESGEITENPEIVKNAQSAQKAKISLDDALLQNAENQNEKIAKDEKTEKKNNDDVLLYAVLAGRSVNDLAENGQKIEKGENAEFAQKIKAKKTESAAKISVIDERTSENPKKTENFVTKIEKTDFDKVEMSMDLNSKVQNSIEFDGVVKDANASEPSSFSRMLSQQIQTNSADFVKAGNLILKDNNKGTINLVLHPEDLGNVKIQLEMSDKVVAGKIVVATKEAYDAFNQNMNSLRDAFVAEGFENASFDLSWSGEEKNENQQKNFYGTIYDENVPNANIDDDSYGIELARDAIMYGSSIVNVMV